MKSVHFAVKLELGPGPAYSAQISQKEKDAEACAAMVLASMQEHIPSNQVEPECDELDDFVMVEKNPGFPVSTKRPYLIFDEYAEEVVPETKHTCESEKDLLPENFVKAKKLLCESVPNMQVDKTQIVTATVNTTLYAVSGIVSTVGTFSRYLKIY